MKVASEDISKAFLYSRCSTLRQEDGESLERQRLIGEKFIKDHQLELVKDIQDIGVPAYKGLNTEKDAGLGQFLAACKGKGRKIPAGSTLVIEKIDRLTRRGLVEGERILLDLYDAQINLGIAEFNMIVDHKDDNNLIAKMQISNALWMGKKESEYKSQRINDTFNIRRDKIKSEGKIWTKKCPYWLKFNEDTLGWEETEYANTIRLAFKLKVEGLGNHSIALKFNELKIDTPPPKNSKKEKLKKWGVGSINYIFTSKQVIGEYNPKTRTEVYNKDTGKKDRQDISYFEKPIENYYLAIVDNDLYIEAMRKIAKNTKTTKAGKKGIGGRIGRFPNLFRGITKCFKCNTAVVIKRGQGGKVDYLCCNDSVNCKHPTVQYKPLENYLVDHLKDLDALKVKTEPDIDTEIVIRNKKSEIYKLEENLETQKSALKISTAETMPIVMHNINDITGEIKSCNQKLDQLSRKPKPDSSHELLKLDLTSIEDRQKYNMVIKQDIEVIYEYRGFIMLKPIGGDFFYMSHPDIPWFENFSCLNDSALEEMLKYSIEHKLFISTYALRWLDENEIMYYLDTTLEHHLVHKLLDDYRSDKINRKRLLRLLKEKHKITYPPALMETVGIFKEGTIHKLMNLQAEIIPLYLNDRVMTAKEFREDIIKQRENGEGVFKEMLNNAIVDGLI